MSTTTLPRLRDYTHDLDLHQRTISFVRYLSALHENKWAPVPLGAVQTFARRWPRDAYREVVEKAAVNVGTMSDTDWAPLAAVRPLANAFVEYAYAATVLGKLAVTTVPFNASVPAQTTPGVFTWVGENKVKPLTKFDYATVTLGVAKSTGMLVLTDELLKLSSPGTETFLRNALTNGVSAFVDAQFLDPSVAAVANVHPASITNGVTPITPSGTTSAALKNDVSKLLGDFFAANPDVASAALVCTPSIAAMLAGVSNSPTLMMSGGTYQGVPVVASASAGTAIVMVDASQILVASGGIRFDSSRNASVQMSDAPTDPPTAASVPISLWQENLVALRVEYAITWTRARTSAVKLISPTAYVAGT